MFDEITNLVKGSGAVDEVLKQVGGDNPITELLTDQFINGNTNFSNLTEMLQNSNVPSDNNEDIKEHFAGEEGQQFIQENTKFNTFEEMIMKAVQEKL